MLAIRDLQVDVEQYSSRQASTQQKVYKTIRYPSPLYNKGPYYQIDTIRKKYYRLLLDTIESLVKYVQDGNILETYNNVPYNICQQLYDKE